jgi:VIT1/CCC1 family predicted Fe2+/Mn2+ transporter
LHRQEQAISRLSHLPEKHLVDRIGWLRAAVLGANDGIISTASLIVGVAAAAEKQNDVLIAVKPEHHTDESVNLIWINALEQHSVFITLDAEGGGSDASLIQSPVVDFQSLERLESSLLGLC